MRMDYTLLDPTGNRTLLVTTPVAEPRQPALAAALMAAEPGTEQVGFFALTEEGFSSYLYSAGIPDPDLLIRPGGEKRISNFLLWQCAYSEFYFTDVLWPDFTPEELDRAIAEFRRRDRRFGGVKNG